MAQTKIKLIADGVIDVNNLAAGHTITTDNIGEGSNLYYTDARVSSYLTTNSYATESFVSTAVANLVDAAPTTLDTLNELAAALGDDPNFATTVTNSIATKLPLAGGNITGNFTVDTNTLYVDATNNRVSINGIGGDTFNIFSAGYPLASFIDGSTVRGRLGYVFDWGHFALQSEADLVFRTGSSSGTEKVRITSAGNVGIGTSSPNQKLSVASTNGNTSLAVVNSTPSVAGTETNYISYYGTSNGGALFTTALAQIGAVSVNGGTPIGKLVFKTTPAFGSPTDRLTIDQDGNVGIGTNNINAKLEIAQSTDNTNGPSLRISNLGNTLSNGQLIGALEFYNGDDSGVGNNVGCSIKSICADAVNPANSDFLVFSTGGNSERLRIDSIGNLLVGTTNADIGGGATGFKVVQNGQVYSSTDSTAFSVQPLYLDRRGTNNVGDMIKLALGGFFKSSIGVLGTNSPADDGGITFSTISNNATKTERVRIDNDGLKFNGDTAAANALDDYEEGTWTAKNGAGVTVAGNFRYTKIGNVVTVWGIVDDYYTQSADNNRITNLPFTASSTYGGAIIGNHNLAYGTISGYVSNTAILFSAGNTAIALTSGAFRFSAVYQV